MAVLPELKALLPEENLSYYESTNAMHCGPGEGGSKFNDDRVKDIFDVIAMRPDLMEKVKQRLDDREALKVAGAPESAFLPAVKGADAPPGLPEALYYKVEGVEGRLGIVQLKDLPSDTKIMIHREKGVSKTGEKSYTPVSFTVIKGSVEDMPKTDFATIIVGRSGGAEGKDEVWTMHPGAPVRPIMKEFTWTQDLRSPEELAEGEVQKVRVMTVGELLAQADLSPEDYVKITPGALDEVVKKYEVAE